MDKVMLVESLGFNLMSVSMLCDLNMIVLFSKVLGLGRVAISKDQHMDKMMLVESLGFNLMSVSMLCDLNMIVIFGKYRCLVLMEFDKSLVFEGYQKDDLYMVDF